MNLVEEAIKRNREERSNGIERVDNTNSESEKGLTNGKSNEPTERRRIYRRNRLKSTDAN